MEFQQPSSFTFQVGDPYLTPTNSFDGGGRAIIPTDLDPMGMENVKFPSTDVSLFNPEMLLEEPTWQDISATWGSTLPDATGGGDTVYAVVPTSPNTDIPSPHQHAPQVPTGLDKTSMLTTVPATKFPPHAATPQRDTEGEHPISHVETEKFPKCHKRPARLRQAPKRYTDSMVQGTAGYLSGGSGDEDEEEEDEEGRDMDIGNESESDYSDADSDASFHIRSTKRRRVQPSEEDNLVAIRTAAVRNEMEEEEDDDDENGVLKHFRQVNALHPKEEAYLRRQLAKQMRELESSSSQMRGLSSSERKKVRNRKASRISRLKKKLSVFDLQVSYEKELKERQRLAKRCALLEAEAQLYLKHLHTYDPGFKRKAQDEDNTSPPPRTTTREAHSPLPTSSLSPAAEDTPLPLAPALRRSQIEPPRKRTRAGLKEQEEAHCLCGKSENSAMVECTKCHGWFHLACVNLSEKEAKRAGQWSCPACVASG